MARVLIDFRVRRGGPARYAEELLAGLAASGEVDPVVHPESYREREWLDRPFTPWGRGRASFAARAAGADLLHALHLELPRTRVPSVVTIHDLVPLQYPASMPGRGRRLVYRHVLASALRRAERVIVPSPSTAAALGRLGAPRSRIAVVPLTAGPAFQPVGASEREAARARFAGGSPYVAAAAGTKAHKNPAGLAAAAALIVSEHGVPVVAAGEGASDANVRFVGHLPIDAVQDFYAGAEALIVPSHLEGFGLPALESLACGVPVVCGAGLGALPYVRSGVLEVDVRQPAEIVAAVVRLLDDATLRARLADAGQAAAAELSRERMARATLDVYRSVLRRYHP